MENSKPNKTHCSIGYF